MDALKRNIPPEAHRHQSLCLDTGGLTIGPNRAILKLFVLNQSSNTNTEFLGYSNSPTFHYPSFNVEKVPTNILIKYNSQSTGISLHSSSSQILFTYPMPLH